MFLYECAPVSGLTAGWSLILVKGAVTNLCFIRHNGGSNMKIMHAALAAILLSGCAMAADGPGVSQPGMAGHGMGGDPHQGPGQVCHIVGSGHHMDGTLAFLKAELKISAKQAAAWDGFAAAFAAARPDGHGGMKHEGKKARKGPEPLPARMAHHEHMMEMQLAQMKKMHAAIGALHATLGEREKHLADELIPAFLHCRMHG